MALILGRRGTHSRAIGFAERARPEAGELITYSGEGHLITFAPTGTGKTSGPVICNALTHPGQLIVLDMKGEVYKATAEARRAMGQEVHVLDLRDGGEAGSLNPLDLASRTGTEAASIARSFAAEFIDRSDGDRDRFWNDWAETVITGGAAWLLEDVPKQKRKLSDFFDILTEDDAVYRIACLLDMKQVRNRAAKAAFASFLQLPGENTRPSVLGTALSHMRLFDSDLMRRLTDTTSFDLDALIAGGPMSLYIIVPLFRLTAYRPLLRIWLSGLILALTLRKTPPEHRTLLICDEAGNLGRLDTLLTAATLLRSWGLTLWTFWQNAAQLNIYGPQANTLIDNAGVIQDLWCNEPPHGAGFREPCRRPFTGRNYEDAEGRTNTSHRGQADSVQTGEALQRQGISVRALTRARFALYSRLPVHAPVNGFRLQAGCKKTRPAFFLFIQSLKNRRCNSG